MSLQFRELKVHQGSFQLGPLSYEFPSIGLFLIKGPNGSGKTTLLKTLLGRLSINGGEILGLQRPLGAVGVEPWLMGSWTIEENLKWFSTLLRRPVSLPESLRPFKSSLFSHLSQGQKQWAELQIALHLKFSTLLLDEALNALDQQKTKEAWHQILAYSKTARVLMTSHSEDIEISQFNDVLELPHA